MATSTDLTLMDYHTLKNALLEVVNGIKSSHSRFQKISEREDKCDMDTEAMKLRCGGRYCCNHRGCPMLKWPEDMTTFQQLFWDVKPASIIELGSFNGGSALWMADMLRMLEIDCSIHSVDIDLSLLSDVAKDLKPKNLTFIQGDSNNLGETFTDEFFKSLPRPLLIIDDAHVNLYKVMEFFHPYMGIGDYFIIEDLSPEAPDSRGYGLIESIPYKRYGSGDITTVKKFLSDYADYYSVDSFYTDLFGYNGVWNWHGYIRKMSN